MDLTTPMYLGVGSGWHTFLQKRGDKYFLMEVEFLTSDEVRYKVEDYDRKDDRREAVRCGDTEEGFQDYYDSIIDNRTDYVDRVIENYYDGGMLQRGRENVDSYVEYIDNVDYYSFTADELIEYGERVQTLLPYRDIEKRFRDTDEETITQLMIELGLGNFEYVAI